MVGHLLGGCSFADSSHSQKQMRREMTTQTIATLFNRFEPVPTAPIKRGPRVDVLVHRCFSQLDGDAKRHHCVCDEHVTPETAAAMVAMGEADYLASFRNTPLGERPY